MAVRRKKRKTTKKRKHVAHKRSHTKRKRRHVAHKSHVKPSTRAKMRKAAKGRRRRKDGTFV